MDLWRAIGTLWDSALAGHAEAAARDCDALLAHTARPADRAALAAFRAFCELLACRYLEGARRAERAAREAPAEGTVRLYVDSVRLLAEAMVDRGGDLDPDAVERLAGRAGVADECGTDRLLVLHPLIEAGMATGRFATVERLVLEHPPLAGGSSVQVEHWVRLQLARSQLFRGQLDAMEAECAALSSAGVTVRHPQIGMLVNALRCYSAAQQADRSTVETLSARVLTAARAANSYVQVGSCLLVSWSLSAVGQVQRAAALLRATAGGTELERIKIWDRAFGYELLVTAALQRGDLVAARQWAALTAPLGRFDVAAASVQRALSRLAAADGDPRAALDRALASAAHDAASGSRIDELRSRMLVANALASSGDHDEAIESLESTAREAELLGAVAVRRWAGRELRLLTDRGGGWQSLTDREREIVALAAEGHSNRTIGATLFISSRTVQNHMSRALRALGIESRAGIPSLMPPTSSGSPPPLTRRQEQVAGLVATGLSNAAIAAELGISTKTVEKHLAGIFARWGASSRTIIATMHLGRRSASVAAGNMPDYRTAEVTDAAAQALLGEYFAFRASTFPGPGGYVTAFPEPEQFVPPRGVFLVVSVQGRELGCGGIRGLEPGVFEVKHLWVRPEAQGQGLGRALLAELERRAIGLGARRLVLDTNESLTAAGGLYRSSGYVETEPYNDNPNATTWYRKRLSPPLE